MSHDITLSNMREMIKINEIRVFQGIAMTRLSKKLNKCGFSRELVQYLLDMVHICEDNGSHFLDINLSKDVYPKLGEQYGVTDKVIKKRVYEELRRYKDVCKPKYATQISRAFDYKGKLTVKKLLILVLMSLR